MVSDAFKSAMNARVNTDELIGIMHIDHADLDPADWPDGIRVTDRAEEVVSNGITYTPWPFTWRRPDQRADRLPQVPISIDNTDPQIMTAIIALTTPPVVRMWTVMASSLDTIEEGPLEFDLQRVSDTRETITGQLGFEPMLWMGYGRITFNPLWFPGAFR